MNTNEYISSGILESYALGLCNPTEAADVESMCLRYPEVKAELEAIQLSLNGYVSSFGQTVPSSIKSEIFSRIDELEKEVSTPDQKTVEHTGGRIISLSRYLAAASIILLGLSIIGNILLYSKWKTADEQLIALTNERNVLADNLKAEKVKLDDANSSMVVLSDTAITRVLMRGVAKSPESLAVIYWNKTNSQVYIDVKNLPKPTSGKQYQLWAIVDGKPVDAGMIPVEGIAGLMKMKDFPSAQAFAITLEKEGGSVNPTLEEMIVVGAI